MTDTVTNDNRPEVEVRVQTTQHPNAVVIKIEILGADADARAVAQSGIMMALQSVTS